MNKTLVGISTALVLALGTAGCHRDESVNTETALQEPAKTAPVPVQETRTVVVEHQAAAPRHHTPTRSTGEVARFEAPVCSNCGTVTNVEPIVTKGTGNAMGTIAGAVIGGVIGHQFGNGRGNTAATAAGAAGGAYAGNRAQANYNKTTTYRVTVSMADGTTRTIDLPELNGIAVGNKVKVSGNTISPA